MDNCKVIAVTNQKGGVGKTTTTVNLGAELANLGHRVLLIDADPQGSLTVSLGIKNPDELEVSLSTLMEAVIRDKSFSADSGILKTSEGVDLLPSNIELSGMETGLVNTMSREFVLKSYVLYITITHKTVDEMALKYNFNADQIQLLNELLDNYNDSVGGMRHD